MIGYPLSNCFKKPFFQKESFTKEILYYIYKTELRIIDFEQKYNISTEQIIQKIRVGMDDDNLDYVEWVGATKILKRVEEVYKELEGLRVCL